MTDRTAILSPSPDVLALEDVGHLVGLRELVMTARRR